MGDYFDLGTYTREVSTTDADAALWFNRGLIWCYGFHHEEACRCFVRASECDQGFGLAHWGIAYASGPYYNKQWDKFDPDDLERTVAETYRASREAFARIAHASEVEQALIAALLKRFQASKPADDIGRWNDDYADAMRDVHRRFPGDPDVCTLFADAMMNRTPWALWDIYTGKPGEGADTLEVIDVLETRMAAMDAAGEAPHPGLLHLHIHAVEMSPEPERALRSADRLRHLTPDVGHLNHMPTHIDAQCGRYQMVVDSNAAAIAADHKQVERYGLINFQALSRAHNHHFKLYGAMLLGNWAQALSAAKGMVETLPEELLRIGSPPMADWLEGYVAMQYHPYIRFGKWHDILRLPEQLDPVLYCSTVAMRHYARTLALAVLGRTEAADAEMALFRSAAERVPPTRMVFNNTVRDILAIAVAMAEGEVAYRKREFDAAFAALRRAVRLADDLPYDEPWGWMQPARHALGALLLEQGRVEEALEAYRADLGLDPTVIRCCQHPDNVWALHGYHECLVKLDRTQEAAAVRSKLDKAVAGADVPVRASCLCRLDCAGA